MDRQAMGHLQQDLRAGGSSMSYGRWCDASWRPHQQGNVGNSFPDSKRTEWCFLPGCVAGLHSRAPDRRGSDPFVSWQGLARSRWQEVRQRKPWADYIEHVFSCQDQTSGRQTRPVEARWQAPDRERAKQCFAPTFGGRSPCGGYREPHRAGAGASARLRGG